MLLSVVDDLAELRPCFRHGPESQSEKEPRRWAGTADGAWGEVAIAVVRGLDHGFFSDASLPESVRAYGLITKFFAENVGAARKKSSCA